MPGERTDVATLPCNLCGETAVEVLATRSRSGRALRSVGCRRCGLAWTDPRPQSARQFYEHEYRLAYKHTYEPRAKHVLRAGRVALARLALVRPWLGRGQQVLDVGSGGGEFAHLLQTLGHRVRGVEPNRGYANYAAQQYGLDVQVGFIGDVALPARGFDVITIWHVLEHTEDPGAVLRQLAAALRPGGTLVVEVPNIEATCQSPRSTFHEAHLYHFNLATLTQLAARAGLTRRTHVLSDDGGNLTVMFTPDPAAPDSPAAALAPDNAARVARIVRGHTPVAHLLSAHPWRRFAGRMLRALDEQRVLRLARASGRDLLDRMYAEALSPAMTPAAAVPAAVAMSGVVSAPGAGGARAMPALWPWIVGAYLLAVALEWVLLDGVLAWPAGGDELALGTYFAVQSLVVVGLGWMTQRPSNLRQFARFAGIATPLFALPAVC